MADYRLPFACGFCATKAAHRTQANKWGYLWYPDCLRPYRDDDELTYNEWMKRLADAGVNLVTLQLTGSNVRYDGGACGLEPPPAGSYNIWHSVLDPNDLDAYRADQVTWPVPPEVFEASNLCQIVKAAEKHDIKLWITFFHNKEFTGRWKYHAWNQNNQYINQQPCEAQDQGFVINARDIFTDPTAVEAAKERIQFVLDVIGDSPAVAVWQIMDEMAWLVARRFWDEKQWGAAMAAHVHEEMVPWVAEIARYIRKNDPHTRHIANSHPWAPDEDTWPDDPNHYRNLLCALHDIPEIDVIGARAYFNGNLDRAAHELRMLQERFPLKIVVLGEYWPFAHGDEAASEDPPHLDSKLHQWLNVCGSPHAWAALRWPGLEERDVNAWIRGGYADPDMHEIAAVTRQFAEDVTNHDWITGQNWAPYITSDSTKLIAAFGDGQHVKVLIRWTDQHNPVTITHLQDGDYYLHIYDHLTGQRQTYPVRAQGGQTNFHIPSDEPVGVFYLEKTDRPPPPPPEPPEPPPPEPPKPVAPFLAEIEFLDPEIRLVEPLVVRITPMHIEEKPK